MKKQYGIVEFIGDNVVARLRYKTKYMPTIIKCLNQNGYFKNRDFEFESEYTDTTTIKFCGNKSMITRLKIAVRKEWINDINGDINFLNSKL